MTRRMFSDEITTSDAFLDMPSESQLLYFHVGMNADDDGFISNVRMIQRTIGASDDSVKLLIAKKFLLQFDTGIMVVKHWRMNNQIRKDRYRETKYLKEKSALFVKENGAYTFNSEGSMPVPRGHFLPSGNQLATNGQPSIGKVSIGKVRNNRSPIKEVDFEKAWVAYPRKVGKGAARKVWFKIVSEDTGLIEKIISSVEAHKKTSQWQDHKYIPHFATFLNQERWEDDIQEEVSAQQQEAIIIS